MTRDDFISKVGIGVTLASVRLSNGFNITNGVYQGSIGDIVLIRSGALVFHIPIVAIVAFAV